jgi:transcriptional regulator with PAS, ATPase and Fis domain
MLQGKLLRVLQERQFMRVGSTKMTQVNIRVIAATNRNLRERIQAGQFRDDLYYRLNALSLIVPPLRDRPEDIFLLLKHFLAEQNQAHLKFTPEARSLLLRYGWPGNIRELGNVANHITLMAVDPVTISALPSYLVGRTQTFEAEEKILQTRCGLERALDVLAVLDQYADQGRKAGRNSIKDALKNQERPLSEAEVRSVLQVLGELGFVRSTVGRQGTELSAQGHQLLNWLSNRSFT